MAKKKDKKKDSNKKNDKIKQIAHRKDGTTVVRTRTKKQLETEELIRDIIDDEYQVRDDSYLQWIPAIFTFGTTAYKLYKENKGLNMIANMKKDATAVMDMVEEVKNEVGKINERTGELNLPELPRSLHKFIDDEALDLESLRYTGRTMDELEELLRFENLAGYKLSKTKTPSLSDNLGYDLNLAYGEDDIDIYGDEF